MRGFACELALSASRRLSCLGQATQPFEMEREEIEMSPRRRAVFGAQRPVKFRNGALGMK